jgi:AAA domain
VSTASRLDVLAYWRSVELFSPQPIPKPGESRVRDLALTHLAESILPWQDDRLLSGERLKPSQTLQHDVFVGVYSLDTAYTELHRALRYPDEGENGDPPRAGDSALAAFTVADDGCLIRGSQVLSSCAWGISRAFAEDSGARAWLADFERAAAELSDAVDALSADDNDDDDEEDDEREEGVGPLVDGEMIEAIHGCVMDLLVPQGANASDAIVAALSLRVRSRIVGKVNRYRATERNFLNSFIARDLETVARAVAGQACGSALATYLSSAATGDADASGPARIDVERRLDYVREALQPKLVPPGRWPSAATAQADLGQQLAVNTIANSASLGDAFTGLIAVNGPPGTGKTTMLRDVLAALVVEHAQRIAELESPDAGFRKAPIKLPGGARASTVYRLIPELTGFEMVLACATNAAAENVSTEVPLIGALAPEWHDKLEYFAATARSVLDGRRDDGEERPSEAWGMLAACLGSLSRCKAFATAFWFERGEPESTGEDDLAKLPNASKGLLSILRAHKAAPEDWSEAVAAFRAALKHVTDRSARHQSHADLFAELDTARSDAATHARQAEHERTLAQDTRRELDAHEQAYAEEARERDEALAAHRSHRAGRPGLTKIIRSLGGALRRWRDEERTLAAGVASAERILADSEEDRAATARVLAEHEHRAAGHAAAREQATARIERLEDEILSAAGESRQLPNGAVFPDDEWADASRRDARELRAPWLEQDWDSARTELFIAALRLHEAFVLANASKMRQSLSVAIDMIQGSHRGELSEEAALAAWQCLFMVVPMVSTTFASYPRLFRNVGREALGWVLIDEAGQSSPQNAVGPIWRSRAAVVIGDPLQLEPVVTLPLGTQQALRHAHGVEESLLPSRTSLQALADRVAQLGTHRECNGEIWVGAPLSVHRRCDEPMFSIVNEIAYAGQMVNHTPPRAELSLPPSAWLHVAGESSQGHWIPEEGHRLERLLDELAILAERRAHDIDQLFLIAPFRDVANRLGGYEAGQLQIKAGTIHTAQGREADVVIIVLGGATGRTGDKRWAAEKPNLLNVAVSRARRRLYVIGNRDVWSGHRYFDTLAAQLPVTE